MNLNNEIKYIEVKYSTSCNISITEVDIVEEEILHNLKILLFRRTNDTFAM